ncbi:hypothetical protein, partial [Halorubrum ezzemoulense]|uniref:hypothetical protein n=1 Tax=Halorubrum ezzemoulense TaxID=337243 RepID=UPI001B80997E
MALLDLLAGLGPDDGLELAWLSYTYDAADELTRVDLWAMPSYVANARCSIYPLYPPPHTTMPAPSHTLT